MKKIISILVVLITLSFTLYGNGVAITDSEKGLHLALISSEIEVNIENQIAITKTSQTFKNDGKTAVDILYGFPLQNDASAIQLRWFIDDLWYLANISATPDSGGSGIPSNMAAKFEQYLGDTPLMFPIEQELAVGGEVIIELQYVSLLPYSAGKVTYTYPNNYDLIQNSELNNQQFSVSVLSQRVIESLEILSHNHTSFQNNGYNASIEFSAQNCKVDKDFEVEYSLSLDELGLFGISTFLPDSIIPDDGNRGFMAFIAEPDPDNTAEIIQKRFTLIIDCSGSMSGERMTQAKNAASFIVNNLNSGDYFNICDFATDVNFFRESHVEFNVANQNAALDYINGLVASGWTNISGALTSSIAQYANASENTANIIIFFTDGQPTMGLTDTQKILDEVAKYVSDLNSTISLYSFGIGTGTNEQLLSILATSNNGIVGYLGDEEIEEKITEFYSIIKSPVLLNTSLNFQPAMVMADIHPEVLPNLYQGQQMLVVGRYEEPGEIGISLDGEAFQQDVNYQYTLSLSDSNDVNKQFLPKVWAKMAIEDLLVKYYNYDPNSAEAIAIKNEVKEISFNYGVISPFTKFSGGDPQIGIDEGDIINNSIAQDFHLLGNFPNPFNPSTSIHFQVDKSIVKIAHVRIYNALGQLVKTLAIQINGVGEYSVFWDGTLANGQTAPTGSYIYVIELNNTILTGKMTLMK